eukprot:s3836_g7.t1
MPTCLTHFCAEWRRARRVLQVQNLDLETKRELYSVLTSDLLVGCDGPLAERHGVGFWQADFDEAAGVRIWLMQTGTVVAGSTDEVDTNDGDNQPDESLSTASRSINLRSKSGALGLLKGLAARPSPKKFDDQASVFSWNLQQIGAAKGAAAGEHHLLFRNPDHPMSQFPNEANKEEFVGLMKKSLMAESLFSEGVGPHHRNEEQAIATTQDAEDLFEALLIHQQICRLTSGSVLQLGRVMDELVKRWSILTKFRQLIERDTATIGTFIQTYFLTPKVKYIDSNEIYHFFRGGPGLCDVTVEEVLASLDEDGDGKVDLQECQRQLSLVAPPRPSLLELGSQLELKHGLGRSAISSGLKEPASLFEHLCTVEKVSPPPEDVARLYRAINSSRASREIGTESLSQMLRQPPLDIQWGVEVHTIPALYDALACRMLTVERSRQKDAAVLPSEAFVQGEVPEVPELERRFAHLWDMYGSSLVGSVSAQSASKFREHCFAMYQHHADQIAVWRSNHSGELRRGQMVSVHKSLFPSIGDVVTTASCRLVAGQTCVVRYRLQGPCSYYGSGHTVLKDEREPVPWPVPRKVLGDTPFIALVPPGLSYCAAGGGGFYLGHQAFNNVDPNLRADLPKSSDGQPQMLGHVEMSMPSFSRSQRGGSGKMPKSQVFELRLFCSSKQRIIGCIGEPVKMTVWNQMPPPPLESLQLRCEGRNVTLRWNALDLLDLPKEAQADHVRVLVKTSTSEETVVLKPEVTEHELQDLIPDTEYEFRVRAENVAGSSRDCVAHCRINAYCPAPAGLTCASIGTAQVELEWSRPGKIGNEATKDAYQIHTEQIQRYIATLRVVDSTGDDGNEEGSDGSSPRSDKPHRSRKRAHKHNLNPDAVKERPCQWLPEALREDRGRGIIQATLLGLRPDTRYMLFGLCAENSVGSGACSPNLEFWTIPLVPRVERCRVRQGQVLLALSETGGACVHEYAVSVLKEGMPDDNAVSWTIPQAALQPEGEAGEVNAGAAEVVRAGTPQGALQLPELPLPFAEMPAAESTEKHFLRLRARNSGGWSECPWPHWAEGNRKALSMSLNKLSEVEAFRAQVLLEEALRKLSFLTSISSSASVHGDELTQFMGDEISRIIQDHLSNLGLAHVMRHIRAGEAMLHVYTQVRVATDSPEQEQRDLERKYEERIAARGQLKGLCNKAKFMETQREIQEVAHKLKESNKSLCRNLKENPNVQGNLIKMQQERWQVTEWLEETKKELGEMSFAILVSKVEQERREQERLSEEQKNSQAVKDLEDDLQRERIANQEIKELKEELQKNKTISDIEYKFEEKKLSAREKALLRIHDQMLQKLEKDSAGRACHLADHEKEVDNRTVELDMLKERRAAAHQELAELEERRGLEADSYKEKENEMRNAVLVEKQRREQYQRMAEAVLFLQEEGRNYMARLDARRAAMKGKKGKKGKKKWSPSFTTAAISRQQGADLAEAAIIAAINSPSIEQLEQVLRASKGIEFQDYKYVHEARALLLRLREVKNDLADAMKARFPEQLREALQAAIDAKLQGIDKARSLLDKLDLVVDRLDTAKGLTPLKAAIEAAETARLPEEIIVVGRERLIRREAAQQGLEEAIEAARVPDLLEALKAAEGMDLPAEPEARERVELLGQTQGALQKAMSTKVIPDLSAALTLASKAGLKEHQMIHEARSLLSKLMNRRENVKKELEKAVKFRHPVKLKMTIMSARLAQVSLKRILDAEEVRKRVEELLEAMADAAGIEEREKTLADAVAYSIPAELLKRFEIELEELKALHDAIRHGDPEVLRECIEKCEDLGIKVVELLEARVLYRDWEAACQKIDVEASVQRVEPLRAAIKAAKDLGVNALVLARGNELLRHLEKRIRMEQELGEALKVRKLEIIASAVRAAGDAGAHDHSLVTRSHDMLEVLQTKRDKLQAASERAELHLMHETLNTVVQSPALPDSETSRAFLKLRALRKKEQIQIVSRLKLAQEAKDFRCGSVLLDRMMTARKADVEMDSQHIGSTEWMQLAEVEQRERIEKDILQERLSRKQMVLSDQAPEASASYILSTGAIVGTMKVLFEPVGTQICILPREIVEANLQVNLEVGKGIPDVDSPKAVTPKKLQTLEGEATIQKSLGVIRKIIGRGDEVKCLRPIDLSWEENARESAFRTLRGLMQVPIAIYIRRDHQCLEIADAICRRCHLGADLWQSESLPSSVIHPLDFCTDPDPVTEDCSTKLRRDDADDVLTGLSRELASSLVQVSRSITPLCSKQLADYTRSVRARVFRSLHLDFAWTYPKGIFDSLDASCLMFDQEKLLDIIDGRGSQASKYGITNTGPYGVAYERRSKSKESSPVHHSSKEKISAINMYSETNYAESRQGKRTVEVRIDMIPSHVTDLVFVVSPTNSRDLSKFTGLQSMVIDAESSEVLASSSVEEQISPGHECAVMLSVYRLDDHLWHVNKIDTFGKGSHRDYRPVIAKVLSLGYPRQQAMKNLVPDVLKRIQAELSVPHPVKDTNVRVNRKNALEFGYAVELTGDQKTLSSEMLQRIVDPMFIEALAETLYDSSSNRISKSHLTISEASYGEAWNLEFEFKYKFPEQDEDTEEDPTNCYLDTTCVLFEGQALREVVDYRGAHGIRWVTNGVLPVLRASHITGFTKQKRGNDRLHYCYSRYLCGEFI